MYEKTSSDTQTTQNDAYHSAYGRRARARSIQPPDVQAVALAFTCDPHAEDACPVCAPAPVEAA